MHKAQTAGAILALACLALTCLSAASDPLTDLKTGANALEAKRFSAAIALIEPLEKRLPKLADYAAWFLASAQFGLKNYAAVPAALEPIWKQVPPSPLAPKAYLLAAQAADENGSPRDAVEILRKNYAALPQPQGDFALAAAFDSAGDQISAVIYYQRVYYAFPTSAEAELADANLSRLQMQLGANFPPSMPNSMLSRALKLLTAGRTQLARKELETLVPKLGGAERDTARVRIGVADYDAKKTPAAQRYLTSLEVGTPDADAERLYYLLLCARRLDNEDEADADLDRLGRLYPDSPWRLQALIAVADHYLVQNQVESYEPLFRTCYESFPSDPRAADCHWKVAWSHYLRRLPDAGELLRDQLRFYPRSEQASAALYFLGRLAERAHDSAAAQTFYSEIDHEYPNQYYAAIARDRLREIEVSTPSPEAAEFLRSISFPERVRITSFEPDATAAARIARARLLASAGLEDLAEGELRFAAQTEDQPDLMAMELASLSSRTMPDQAMRYIKHYASGYLYLPLDSAPHRFWTLAFPLPYRADLERYSKQNGLDPYFVAALIRQESEFNPKAVSRANARGLTQILPSTGRQLSRRLHVQRYTTARLFQPSVNLQLGTYYLKTVTEQSDGRQEVALAAYNAGLTRARNWLTWGDFREPAEFIETVPFTETRNYIETVLRNADLYRRLYGTPAVRTGAKRAAAR